MTVFDLDRYVVRGYERFARSFTDIQARDIEERISEAYAGNRFWPEPMIQLNPRFTSGGKVGELVQSGELAPGLERVFRSGATSGMEDASLSLHKHQLDAITLANQGKSFVVTTGTGSGKSLCYFIPIIDRVLRAKAAGEPQRTRAIVVYPMNALANSQLEELDKRIKHTAFESQITYKRYTGQDDEEAKEKVKAAAPDLLLTNFMMLELLLTRQNPRDQQVIKNCEGLEFLVLDELHTYRGRQGADVAMLVRRVRERLEDPSRSLQCIGTSATMASVEDVNRGQGDVAAVASRLFATPIAASSVITEELQRSTNEALVPSRMAPESLRGAVLGLDSSNATDAALRDNLFMAWIEMTLGLEADDDGGRLRRAKPLDLIAAAERLEAASGVEAAKAREQIELALETAGRSGYARGESHDRPFFPVRLHRFISGAGRVYATLEPIGARDISFEGQVLLPGRRTDTRLYATYFCRRCGQEHHPVTLAIDGGSRTFLARSIDDVPTAEQLEGADGRKEEQGFLTPVASDDMAKFQGKLDEYPDEWLEERRGVQRLKPAYRSAELIRYIVAPDGRVGTSGQTAWFQRGKFRFCAACREVSAQSGRDINRLAGLSAEGRSSATTVLVGTVLRWMKEPAHGRDRERQKVLGFSDNRQDAALQAGHFNDFVFVSLVRGATLAALQSAGAHGLRDSSVGRALAEALGFTTDNKERLQEWLGDRDIEQGQPLADAASDLAAVLGHRFWFDQRRGWRYTFPNLEQLGLIEVRYAGLGEFCRRDTELTGNLQILRPLPLEKREAAFREVLDAARQGLAVRSDSLNRAKLEELHKRRQRLAPPWGLDNDETPREAGLLVVGQVPQAATSHEDRSFVRSGVQSALGRRLRRILGENPKTEEQRKLLLAMCAALKKLGLLVDVPIKDAAAYRISAEGLSFHAAAVPKERSNRYFVELYTTLAETLRKGGQLLFGDEAREHTAQVEQKRRQIREKRFRGREKELAELRERRSELRQLGEAERFLPVMFCSPTMELGVDIADLDAVYLRNVPPTPANYAQRSGRAGRGGAAALVLTYCSAQSPHDQYYFARRREMIQGIVRPPAIDLANRDLVNSHLNAVWLAESEQPLSSTIAEVLDTSQPTRPLRADLEAAFSTPELRERSNVRMARLLKGLAEDLGDDRPEWLADTDAYAAKASAEAPAVFRTAFARWRDLLASAEAQRNEARRILDNLGIRDTKVRNSARALQEMAERQINLLLAGSEAIGSDFYTYRYLATEGFLPGYNFPRLPLMAFIPGQGSDKRQAYVQRPRFLGISEFGPYSRIYHEGRAYRVVRVQVPASELKQGGEKLLTETVHLCRACGARDHRHPERCHACEGNEGFRQIHEVKRIENLSTRPAEHITANDEERQRQGFEIITTFEWSRRAGRWDIQVCNIHSSDGEAIATARYAAAATLQRLNLGLRRRKNKDELGFRIEPGTGKWLKPDDADDTGAGDDEDPAQGRPQRIVPMVEDRKNTLLLGPARPFSNLATAGVVQHGLLRGLETEFQLEEGELLSEPMPGRDDRRAILFYEATEGGAGVLARIARERDALARVAQQALKLMHYEWTGEQPTPDTLEDRGSETCEKGCYRCLLTYFNQPEHERIDRHDPEALDFLCKLAAATVESRAALPPTDAPADEADPLQQFQARLVAEQLPPPKVKASGNGWQLTWASHLVVALLGPTAADRRTLEDMDYRVVEVPIDEARWAAAVESLKSVLEAS
jgi:superfamily II DNA/RNA helicase